MKSLKEEILELSGISINEDWYTDRINEGFAKIVKLVGRENTRNPDMIIKALVEKEKIYDRDTLFKYLYRYADFTEHKAKLALDKNKEFIENAVKKKKEEREDF